MRVTIEHREQTAGVGGNKRNYFVDCLVELSQEERAIIKARSLYDHHFAVDGAEPPRSTTNFIGAGALKGFAPIIGIGGFIWGVFGGGTAAGLLVFGAIGMFIAGFIMDRKPPGGSEPQTITIRRLISNPRILIYAPDPASAKIVEDELSQNLTNLKSLIAGSAEVRGRHSFEL
jgi:hypothetical protein